MLLNLAMSKTSQEERFTPPIWPHERIRVRKTRARMDEERVAGSDTAMWTTNIVENMKDNRKRWKELRLRSSSRATLPLIANEERRV